MANRLRKLPGEAASKPRPAIRQRFNLLHWHAHPAAYAAGSPWPSEPIGWVERTAACARVAL